MLATLRPTVRIGISPTTLDLSLRRQQLAEQCQCLHGTAWYRGRAAGRRRPGRDRRTPPSGSRASRTPGRTTIGVSHLVLDRPGPSLSSKPLGTAERNLVALHGEIARAGILSLINADSETLNSVTSEWLINQKCNGQLSSSGCSGWS